MFFPKGDFRRTLIVIAIIEEHQPISLNKIVELSAMPKGTIQEQIKKIEANQLPEVTLIKEDRKYSISSKNKIINTKQVKNWYLNLLSDQD